MSITTEDLYAKVELDAELQLYLEKLEMFDVLRHPLVISVPYFPQLNNILNKQFQYKKGAIKQALENKNFHKFVFLHERPFRIEALMEIQYEMFDNTFHDLMMSVWIDSENIFENYDLWYELWQERKKKLPLIKRNLVYNLKDETIIYRGGDYLGMSWTTDRDKAQFFAKRNNSTNIFKGKVKKEFVLWVENSRNENEIIVLPEDVEIL